MKQIAEITAHFENSKRNLSFDVNDGTAYIHLVADGLQIAEVAKLLLLKGKQQTFGVVFYDTEEKKENKEESRRKAIQKRIDQFKAT